MAIDGSEGMIGNSDNTGAAEVNLLITEQPTDVIDDDNINGKAPLPRLVAPIEIPQNLGVLIG